jgi:APA family basic amino acid/polyamine antiporter
VIVLRLREAHLPRPFRAWGYPWTTTVVLAGSGLFLIGAATNDPMYALDAAALLAAGGPAYLLMKKRGRTGTA